LVCSLVDRLPRCIDVSAQQPGLKKIEKFSHPKLVIVVAVFKKINESTLLRKYMLWEKKI
jgi:hypothetical protein